MSEEDKIQSPNHSNDAGYEKTDVDLRNIIGYAVASVIVIVVVIVLMYEYFISAQEKMVYEAVLKPESAELRELRAREDEELNSYALLDEEEGRYRIPIDRAMKLMSEEAYAEER
ncbi:MAG: hypothetical protein GF315_06235 [candidate division Zixibacteria bacterium]|nr:hypothetical protein [candidate division Zixibacteria bacterium]